MYLLFLVNVTKKGEVAVLMCGNAGNMVTYRSVGCLAAAVTETEKLLQVCSSYLFQTKTTRRRGREDKQIGPSSPVATFRPHVVVVVTSGQTICVAVTLTFNCSLLEYRFT